MAKQSQNLPSMSVDALLKLRDDIGKVLSEKASDLKRQLSRLTGGELGSARKDGRTSRKGRKVAPKYKGPGGETWAGRGARPKWLEAELKQGRSLEEFLIAKPTKSATSRKPGRAARKSRKKAA